MRSNTALLVTLVIAVVAIQNTQAANRRLNRYLTKHVDNDDMQANLDAAERWLHEQEGKRFKFFSLVPMSDLRKFVALKWVVDDKFCGKRSSKIMLLYGALNLKKSGEKLRRVEKVMLQVYIYHAVRCQEVFPIKYHAKYKQLNNELLLKQVIRLVRNLTEGDKFMSMPPRDYNNPENLFDDYIGNPVSIRRYMGRSILKVALLENAKYDPQVGYLKVPKEFQALVDYKPNQYIIKLLLKNYMIKPCLYYVRELGPDLFIPAQLNARFFHEVQESHRDYYLGWRDFMICRTLINNEELVYWDLIDSLNKARERALLELR